MTLPWPSSYKKSDDQFYRHEIDSFVRWCENNYLKLNLSMTKELVINFLIKEIYAVIISRSK